MRKFKKVLAFALAAAMVVTAAPVTTQAAAMKLNKTTATIYINGSKTYKTVNLDVKNASTKTYSVAFTSSNTKIATVNKTSGVVTPKKNGKVTISAKVTNKKTKNYKTLKCTVTVKTAPTAVKVANKDLPKSLNINQTYDFGSSITPKDATNKRRWSVTKGKGTITPVAGVFTATEAGKVTVQVKDTYSGKTATHSFEVVADAPLAKQTGAKTITISNGVSMKDKTIAVKRGTTAVTLADKDGVVFSEDGKTATITTAAKIIDTEYTITVTEKGTSGAADVVKESKVNGTAEKVTKITVLSDKAAAVKDNNNQYTSATVGYKVENQFAEDITKQTTLNISGTDGASYNAADHQITFTRSSSVSGGAVTPYVISRDVVSVVLVHTETGVSVTQTLTVSDEARVDVLTYDGIYNVDNKKLTDDIDFDDDDFYMLFSATDQYGSKFKSYKKVNVNATTNNDLHVNVAGGLTNIKAEEGKEAKIITVSGKDYLGVKLVKQDRTDSAGKDKKIAAGTASILAIATNSGKSVNETITVEAGGKVESLTVSMPPVIPAGEKVTIDYAATDATGNAVTSYDYLNNTDVQITGSDSRLQWEKDAATGKAKLVFNGGMVDGKSYANPGKGNKGYASYTFRTLNNKIFNVQLTISETARAVAVVGTDLDTAMVKDSIKDVKLSNLSIEDQYGRIMDKDAVNRAIKADGKSILKSILVDPSSIGNDFVIATAAGTTTKAKFTVDLAEHDDVLFTITAPSSDSASLSGKVNVAIKGGDGNALVDSISGSDKDIEFTTVKAGNITDATVEVAKVYSPVSGSSVDYAAKVTVKAKNATLNSKVYSVTADSDLFNVISVKDGKNDVWAIQGKDQAAIKDFTDNKVTEKTSTITITLQGGKEIKKDVVISKDAPKVTEFKLNSDSVDVKSVAASGTSIEVADVIKALDVDTLKDQYGIDVTQDKTDGTLKIKDGNKPAQVRITYEDYGKATVTGNGSSNAKIDFTNVGGTAKATIYVGNISVSVGIVLTK